MDEEVDALKAKLDAFSRRLDARSREFKTTGELKNEEAMGSLRKRHETLNLKLDRAIRAGVVSDILKLEIERDFASLLDDIGRREKEFDAAAIKDAQASPS